jgi:hypothetical protein
MEGSAAVHLSLIDVDHERHKIDEGKVKLFDHIGSLVSRCLNSRLLAI